MEKESKDLYPMLYHPTHFALKHLYGFQTEGVEHIPDEPAIYAANHVKLVDSFLMASAFTEHTGKAMRFGAKKEYFEGRGFEKQSSDEEFQRRAMRNRVMGRAAQWLVQGTRQIPVVREGATRQDVNGFFEAMHETLERGDSIGIHPEGTRSRDGKLYMFRLGAAQIAIRESVPIVPVGLIYPPKTVDVEDIMTRYPRKVVFGEPIHPNEYKGIMNKSRRAERIMADVEDAVAEMTGQEQTGRLADIYRKSDS